MTTKSKGQRQRWHERALQMAAMRERRNADGTRKSWAQIARRFGVNSANACHSVKLHTSRMESRP